MSSMSVLSGLEAQENQERSHCLVEWDEPGQPVGIVKMTNVICKEDEDPQNFNAGDTCNVCVRRGAKKIIRSATIVHIGNKQAVNAMLHQAGEGVESDSSTETDQDEDDIDLQSEATKIRLRKSLQQSKVARVENNNGTTAAELQDKQDDPGSLLSAQVSSSELHTSRRAPILQPATQQFSMSPDHSSTPSQQLSRLPSHLARGHTSFLVQSASTPFGDTRNLYQSGNVSTDHTPFERALLSQLDLLKSWLELQFRELNRKLDCTMDALSQVKEQQSTERHTKKENIDLTGNFMNTLLELNSGVESFVTPAKEKSPTKPVEKGSFEVCCGDPETPNCIYIDVPSALALSRFKELEAFPPKEPTRYALRLLAIFFSDEELAKSNCTKAEGRNLLDRRTLDAIREQVNYKYPMEDEKEAAKRWHTIMTKSLNAKCRTSRKKLKDRARKSEGSSETVTV